MWRKEICISEYTVFRAITEEISIVKEKLILRTCRLDRLDNQRIGWKNAWWFYIFFDEGGKSYRRLLFVFQAWFQDVNPLTSEMEHFWTTLLMLWEVEIALIFQKLEKKGWNWE